MFETSPLMPAIAAPSVTVYSGDALRVLRALPEGSVDSVVCDPPYAIAAIPDVSAPYRLGADGSATGGCVVCGAPSRSAGFSACAQCLLDLEVDAYAAAGMLGQQSQNWHESATHSRGYADNDPQQFGRWCWLWALECLRVLKPGGHLVAFGGTRTWHRLATGIEDAGFDLRDSLAWLYATGFPKSMDVSTAVAGYIERQEAPEGAAQSTTDRATTATVDVSTFEGWGTALKPAHEPIVLARKPIDGTVAHNAIAHGTGGINIDGTRLSAGRWPSNVYLNDQQARVLDRAALDRPSRFFWVAKPDQGERVTVDGVSHPTVKPLELMRELVRLVTPAGGVCLDPFAGSGTTVEACLLEGFTSIGVERDNTYVPLIQQRIHRRTDPVAAIRASTTDQGLFELFEG